MTGADNVVGLFIVVILMLWLIIRPSQKHAEIIDKPPVVVAAGFHAEEVKDKNQKRRYSHAFLWGVASVEVEKTYGDPRLGFITAEGKTGKILVWDTNIDSGLIDPLVSQDLQYFVREVIPMVEKDFKP